MQTTRWFAALAGAFLAVAAGACGSAGSPRPGSGDPGSNSVKPASAESTSGGYVRVDGDKDDDDEDHGFAKGENDEQGLFEAYGTGSSPADKRAIASLVKSYLEAAVAGDATKACALLATSLTQGLSAGASKPGQASRKNCATSITPLLEQAHRTMVAEEITTMTVFTVLVKGTLGLAELGFRRTPEQQLIVEREGRQWKVAAVLGSDLT